jgi:hypothetical protein
MAVLLGPLSSSAATRWSQTYGGPGTHEGPLGLRELTDGSIVVGGHTDSFGTQTGDAWWIRIDADGSVMGERVHGNALPGGAQGIAVDADGGMAVVGQHVPNFFDHDAWIHHVDFEGVIDWGWEFDSDPGIHSLQAVSHTSGGGYVAAGFTAISDAPPIYVWIMELDGGGGLTWQRRYNGGSAEHANFVIQTLDGGYAVAGWTTSSGAGMSDAWLMKVDETGVIEWQKTYGGIYQEEATGLIQTSDGGFALSAFTETFPTSGHAAWALRLDEGGQVLWHAVMGNTEWSEFRDITQTEDGDLVATGRVSSPSTNDLWVVKFGDADGAVLWQRAYEGVQGNWGSRTAELADGDLLIAGVWGWGFAEEDVWLQRTDGEGRIASCPNIHETTVAAASPNIFALDGVAVASDPPAVPGAVEFVSDASTLTIDEKCRAASGAPDPGGSPVLTGRISVSPNPLRTSALISFRLEEPGAARVRIFDVRGRHLSTVADADYSAGLHHVAWDAGPRATSKGGVYYVVVDLRGGDRIARRAVVLR